MNKHEEEIKEVIYNFLEEAPTLFGLPIAFINSDILYNNKKLYLTTSENRDKYINTIYNKLPKKLKDSFNSNNFEDYNILNNKVLIAYHKYIYNDIHLKAKTKCKNFLNFLLNKFLNDDLSDKQKNQFLTKYKMKDSEYTRGLIDYDYSIIGINVENQNLKKLLFLKLKTLSEQFKKENNINENQKTTNGINIKNPVYLSELLKKDIEMINLQSARRIYKIINENKQLYPKINMKVAGNISIPMHTTKISAPIFKYDTPYFSLFFTPFSAYISEKESKNSICIYNINRNTLEECSDILKSLIKKYNLPKEIFIQANMLRLRERDSKILTQKKLTTGT